MVTITNAFLVLNAYLFVDMERAKNMTEVIAGHYDVQCPANIRRRIATLSEITEKGVYNGAQWYMVQNEKVVGPKVLHRIWPEE